MTKYRLYVDEVGDPGLKRVSDVVHRYLSLTGVIAESDYVRRRIHPDMEDIKARYFDSHPDEPVVLHRKELVNAAWPFQALRDSETRTAFDAELLALILDWDYQAITVCLDKQSFVAAGLNARYNPYHYCLTVLLERFVDWLTRRGARGDVMAEARLGKDDRLLKDYFRSLWEYGTETVSKDLFQNALTSRELKPKVKEMNISGLQLADLLAHPSHNEILAERGLSSKPVGCHTAKIVMVLDDKYLRFESRMYGKIFVP